MTFVWAGLHVRMFLPIYSQQIHFPFSGVHWVIRTYVQISREREGASDSKNPDPYYYVSQIEQSQNWRNDMTHLKLLARQNTHFYNTSFHLISMDLNPEKSLDFEKRLVCKWSGFWMGSEIRKPNYLKCGLNVVWKPDWTNKAIFEWLAKSHDYHLNIRPLSVFRCPVFRGECLLFTMENYFWRGVVKRFMFRHSYISWICHMKLLLQYKTGTMRRNKGWHKLCNTLLDDMWPPLFPS